MNKEQSVLLSLVKQSQFGPSEVISFDDVDLDSLYKEALQQSVLGLIASEIPSDIITVKLQEAQVWAQTCHIRYCLAQDSLKKTLDDAGIPFVILKGNASAISYNVPFKRTMGDIDFIVPLDRFDEAVSVLKAAGYVFRHEDDRHVSFKKGDENFELHKRFSHEIDIEGYILSGINIPVSANIDGHDFLMLPKLANGLVLLDHFRGHLKSSVGLRHVVDWMMYVYRNLDDDFWNSEFSSVAKEKGMDTLAITVTRMCQIYLGLPETITWCSGADESACAELMDIILDSGNFGRKNDRGRFVETVSTRIKSKGLFPWLQKAGEQKWEAYKKHHWLKPFCWLYMSFRCAKKGFTSGRNRKQLKDDLKRSNNRYELLKKLGID